MIFGEKALQLVKVSSSNPVPAKELLDSVLTVALHHARYNYLQVAVVQIALPTAALQEQILLSDNLAAGTALLIWVGTVLLFSPNYCTSSIISLALEKMTSRQRNPSPAEITTVIYLLAAK